MNDIKNFKMSCGTSFGYWNFDAENGYVKIYNSLSNKGRKRFKIDKEILSILEEIKADHYYDDVDRVVKVLRLFGE